ncbi:MAG: hypothetical protein WDW38_009776 [Sanguina aurantia]
MPNAVVWVEQHHPGESSCGFRHRHGAAEVNPVPTAPARVCSSPVGKRGASGIGWHGCRDCGGTDVRLGLLVLLAMPPELPQRDGSQSQVVSFIPPDGEFELMRYRCTDGISLPFKVLSAITEMGRTRLECNVQIKSMFSNKLHATQMVVLVPVPDNTAKAKF